MRQPPEKADTGCSSSCILNPSPSSKASARGRAVYASASARAGMKLADPCRWTRRGSMQARSRDSGDATSPSITYSTAGRSSAGVSCATCAMRQWRGSSASPLSACSSPRSSANRLDLPEPLAPMRPMRSPAWTVSSAPSRSGFAPRREAELRKTDHGRSRKSPRFYPRGLEHALHQLVGQPGGEPGEEDDEQQHAEVADEERNRALDHLGQRDLGGAAHREQVQARPAA